MNKGSARNVVFYTPGTLAEAHPYRIIAAGRNTVRRTDAFVTERYHQHTFIMTLSGFGRIALRERKFDASPGTVTWLDTSQKYAHGCHPNHDNWRYLWFGMQGFRLDTLFMHLDATANPVMGHQRATHGIFNEVISNLMRRDRMTDANSAVLAARMIALFWERDAVDGTDAHDPDPIHRAMDVFLEDMSTQWDVARLASSCHQSVSHFHRRFRQLPGTSPMNWIRQERINTAKYLLSVSDDRIAAVGRRCGYPDPYHFSREFSRMTGVTPSQFRRAGRP